MSTPEPHGAGAGEADDRPVSAKVMRRRGSSSSILREKESRTSSAINRISLSVLPQDGEKEAVQHTRFDTDELYFEKYKLVSFLGQGSFGTVTLVTEVATGAEWASKEVAKDKAGSVELRMLEREIVILKRVEHQHIVRLHEVYETPEKTFIVMEVCYGGMLSDVAFTAAGEPALRLSEVAAVIRRVSRAVAYLHDSGIVHRDIKLDNVMLKTKSQLDVKLCDFGLCAFLSKESSNMSMVCGTPAFMAPEVLANQGNYSPLCDVWSIGVMLYVLVTGKMPFRPRSEDESLLTVIRDVPVDYGHEVFAKSGGLAELLQAMLKHDPARRMTAKEVLDYGWINGRQSSGAGTSGNMQLSGVLDMMMAFAAEQGASDDDDDAAGDDDAGSGGSSGGDSGGDSGAGGGGTGSGVASTHDCESEDRNDDHDPYHPHHPSGWDVLRRKPLAHGAAPGGGSAAASPGTTRALTGGTGGQRSPSTGGPKVKTSGVTVHISGGGSPRVSRGSPQSRARKVHPLERKSYSAPRGGQHSPRAPDKAKGARQNMSNAPTVRRLRPEEAAGTGAHRKPPKGNVLSVRLPPLNPRAGAGGAPRRTPEAPADAKPSGGIKRNPKRV